MDSEKVTLVNSEKSKRGFLLLKRIVDIICSIFGLILLSPIFLIIGIFIKLEDPAGTIFFNQIRIGKNEKKFKMYKFRSMYADAEKDLDVLMEFNEIEGAMFKMKNDPRVTKVGKFIRKTSLDEFPQLLNVLKGDMSIVGPRPPLEKEVEKYSKKDKRRLSVTPGCTGLWQISGRNELNFNEMVELDLRYIREQSMLMDIKIIFLTVIVLIKSKAY